MFSAITGYFFGDSSSQQSQNTLKEIKPLKSDISNQNINSDKKRTIIKGEKNKFDFSEEYEEEEPKPSLSTSENSSSSENENKKILKDKIELMPSQKIDNYDYWRMAHSVYTKNSLININTLKYVPFIKEKKKKGGILSYIGLGNDKAFEETKYLVGFDENFIYMIDLSKEENKDDNDGMKTIGNHYDITKISNVEIDEDKSKNKILINILFVIDNDIDNFNSKVKKFYFEKKNALKFLNTLKAYINNYKKRIKINDKVFGNINFNEIKDEKDEKDEKKEKEEIAKINEAKDNMEDKKDNNDEEKVDKKEDNNENKKENDNKEENEDEEIFTSENVEEKIVEKENKNLIDI